MHRPIAIVGVAVCVAVFGACASANRGGRDTKIYEADITAVVEAATAVFVGNNLDIEDQAWTSDESFVLTGYIRSGLVRSGGEAVRVGSIQVYIDRVNDRQAKVRVVTSARDTPAMASSADRRADEEAQWFFSRLEANLR